MSLFLVGIGIISFGSPKLKLRHSNAKLVSMPNSLGYLLLFPISGVLTPQIGNSSFYSFESMVLRFLLQLESSNSDHQNSSYCILHPDYSNLQSRIRLFLHIAPLWQMSGNFGVTICIYFLQVNYSPRSICYP